MRNFIGRVFPVMGLMAVLAVAAGGDDWPQWLGPRGDGVWREDGILSKFPVGGPPVKWRANIGGGYSVLVFEVGGTT